ASRPTRYASNCSSSRCARCSATTRSTRTASRPRTRWSRSSGRRRRRSSCGPTTSRRARSSSRRRPGRNADRLGLVSRRRPAPPPPLPPRVNVVLTPTMVGQVIISGILSGVLYGMVALGLALIFGVMRIINVAHGPLLMLGAYTTYFLYSAWGLNPYLSVPISMVVLFAVGLLLERTLVFRVIDAPELSSLLLTFGISIALVNAAQLAFTSDLRSVEYLTASWVVGPFALSKSRTIAFLFAGVVTAAAFLFLGYTRLGKAIRATSQSRDVAMVCGIDVGAIHRLTFGLACALAAAGGALIAVIVAIQPEMGQIWTFKSFLVIVLGGAGNYPGALLGGMLLGLVEQLASLFLTTQLSEVVAYVLLVLVLLVRPTGLLGGRQT